MQVGELLTDDKRTQQFTVFDIFAAMTFVAILLAMFVPWIRWMKPSQRINLLFPLGLQLLMLSGAATYAFYRRRSLVERGGRRLGIAFFGVAKWAGWLPIKSILLMAFLAAVQILIAIGISVTPQHAVTNFVYSAQFSYILAQFGVNFLWRVYPSTLEFFENGVTSGGILLPWSQVDIRESQFFSDRIGIMLKPIGSNVATSTRMARVSDELRAEIKRRRSLAATAESNADASHSKR